MSVDDNILLSVLKDPPYQVAEAGYGSFFLPIEVYFKNKEEPRKLKFDYDLFLPVYGSPPIDHIRSEALTFKNPTDEFKKKLIKGGGIATGLSTANGLNRYCIKCTNSYVHVDGPLVFSESQNSDFSSVRRLDFQ